MILKKKEIEKKEAGVTLTVGIILATFLICTMPAAIIMEIDPEAEKYSWVRGFRILILIKTGKTGQNHFSVDDHKWP